MGKQKKKENPTTDDQHFQRLLEEVPEGSPLGSLTKWDLREAFGPIDQFTLIQIDPTRKHPYSIVFTELFSDHSIPFNKLFLYYHQNWLAVNDPDGLKAYNEQLLKCSNSFQYKDEERLTIAGAAESMEAVHDRGATREHITTLIRENDPDFFSEKISTEARDLFKRVERIYSIKGRPAQRPKKKNEEEKVKKRK